ncbi:MAG: transcriptional regulator [Alphaproteobacteria bacterium]|nr:transcriptional regulator [Alphaproteobacteria bacterium]
MPLTRKFRETVKARAERDPEFRVGLFREAVEALLSDDLETGKILLRDYVNATVGFETLAAELNKSPKSLMRMLSDKGNPRADNLLGMVGHLKKREGIVVRIAEGGGA